MKKTSTHKHLLTGTSVFAVAALSVAVLPSQAFAAWGSITAATTTAQAAAASAEELNLSGAGNISVTGAAAATNTNKTLTKVIVNTTATSTGIISDDNSAVSVTGAGTLSTLTVTKGVLTGGGTATGTATVILDGAAADTTITNDTNGTITNTGGAGGVAIYIGKVGVNKVTMTNNGLIVSKGAAGNDAIFVDDKATATFALTNTGTITSGATGNAIKVAGATSATIIQTSGAINGGISLGTAATSTLAVNGGTITGNVALGDAGQVMTLGGGQVVGKIDGPGLLNATKSYVTDGHIGSGTDITKLTITDGTVFNTATNNNTLKATNIAVGTSTAGATLTVGSGAITGALNSGSAATSTINFTKGVAVGAGHIGATTGFATINITDGQTLDALTNNATIKATNVYLGTSTAGGTLTLGTSAVIGAIDSKSAGTGVLNFGASQTNVATIGGTSSLATINIADNADVIMNANAAATTTKVGSGTNGSLTLNTGKTLTGAVNISATGKLFQQAGSTITGLVDGISAGVGIYNISGSGVFTQNNAIAATNGLAAFTIGDGVDATLNANIKATTVTIGGGAAATATQTAGLITGNVEIDDSATLNIAGGSGWTGTLNGQSASAGTLNVASALTPGGNIGATNALSVINVNNGGTLNLNGSLKAVTTTVNTGGRVNFGTTARAVTGAITATSTGIVDFGTKSNTMTGDLTTGNALTTLTFNVNSNTANDNGNIAVTGNGSLITGTIINIDTSKATDIIKNNKTYVLITDSGNLVDNNAVTISGNTAFLTFTQDRTVNGTLSAKVARTAYATGLLSANTQRVGTVLDSFAGASGNTQIDAFQVSTQGMTTAQAELAFASLTPQIQATSVMSSNAVQKSLDVVSARGSDLRAGIDNSSSGMTAGGAVADKGIWTQAFGTAATMDTRNGVLGYDADTYGAAVGADTMVADHTRAGVSVSYANTSVDSNSISQNTDIDTYQVNLYGFHDMGQWYADGLLGFAWQEYDSSRTIAAGTANGDYEGQTYTVRANTGYRMDAGNGFQIIPNGGLTYIHNAIDGYTETGAGGLNLTVRDYDSQALFGRIGFDVAKDFSYNSMVVRPSVRAAYLYDFIGDQADTTALFTGGGAAFRVQDASPARSSFNVGASMNIVTTKNVTLSADYDYLAKSDFDSHSGMLRARFGF